MPLFTYRFAAGALDRFADHQTSWQAVWWVLHFGHPTVREHIGASLLRLTAADQHGHLLMVVLHELADEDGTYEILSARYLEPDESAAASTLLTPRPEKD